MTSMPFADLEQAYQDLAEAIDRAGPAHENLFLVKLAMTLAHKLGDLAGFKDGIAIALCDLADATPEPRSAELP